MVVDDETYDDTPESWVDDDDDDLGSTPPPGAMAYVNAPSRLVFGLTVWCPVCHGLGKNRKKESCRRCDGVGIVPNSGPIASPKT